MQEHQDFTTNILEQERLRTALAPSVVLHNRQAIFTGLAAAGLVSIEVEFDGYGDSGQIESIHVVDPSSASIDVPSADVEIRTVRYDGSGVDSEFLCLPTALERVCYDLLEFSHPGWENGEGAYGTFTFDVAARSISLVHDERYTASETFEHDF